MADMDYNYSGDVVSGVEPAKKHTGAVIGGVTAGVLAVAVGGGIAAYNMSDLVKNQVKLTISKPDEYYSWVLEKNSNEAASQISEAYREYIEEYCKTSPLDYICFDYYMYMPKEGEQYKLYAGLYDNLNIVSDACRRTGRSLWFVPQVNSRRSDPLVPLTVNNLRFQAFTALAFGAEVLTWACYGKGWWINNVLNEKGEKTQQYEKLKKVNSELHNIGPVYMRYKNKATHYVGFLPTNGLEKIGIAFKKEFGNEIVSGLRTKENSPLLVGEMVSRDVDEKSKAFLVLPSGDPLDVAPGCRTVLFKVQNGYCIKVVGPNGDIALSMSSDGVRSFSLSENSMAIILIESIGNAGNRTF